MFRNYASFYGKELSAHRQNPSGEDHSLSAVRDCLFIIFAATLHIGRRSSIRNLRTCHTVGTGTHLSQNRGALIVDSKETELKVNADKTKYMIMSRVQNAGGNQSVKLVVIRLKGWNSSKIWEQP
jgi:hypothetical protein